MARLREFKTNFTAGELDPKLRSRVDIKSYYNGASKLRNVFIFPQGGVRRRDGLAYKATVPLASDNSLSAVKLIPFVFSDTQRYLFMIYDLGAKIFRDGTLVATISLPFTSAQISRIVPAQNLDTLLLFHGDVETVSVVRSGSDSSWTVGTWDYENVPQYAFPGGTYSGVDEVQSLDLSAASSGSFTLELAGVETVGITFSGTTATNVTNIQNALRGLSNTSATGITVAHAGGHIYTITFGGDDGDREWGTMKVNDNTSGGAFCSTTTVGSTGGEDVWSSTRGWPVCGTFYQGRLWLGGSRDLPNRIWASRPGFPHDFNTRESLPDYGIEAEALSDEVPYFYYVYGGRNLQFFSSTGEWYVDKSANEVGITPENFALVKATSRGSLPGLSVFEVDGATMHVQRGGKALREFIWADVEQSYASNPLSVLSSHLLSSPVSMALRRDRKSVV